VSAADGHGELADSQRIKQLEIFFNRVEGLDGDLVQEPTEQKDCNGDPDFPSQGGFGTPPDQGQRQRTDRGQSDNDKGGAEVPGELFTGKARGAGAFQKLAAMFTLYGGILDFFGAKGAGFHFQLF